ncbi:hypothetical protein ACP70R_004024 [Stipagrostis hirtigluma subsp. patula]
MRYCSERPCSGMRPGDLAFTSSAHAAWSEAGHFDCTNVASVDGATSFATVHEGDKAQWPDNKRRR